MRPESRIGHPCVGQGSQIGERHCGRVYVAEVLSGFEERVFESNEARKLAEKKGGKMDECLSEDVSDGMPALCHYLNHLRRLYRLFQPVDGEVLFSSTGSLKRSLKV